jgi:PAS domain S-box-containing protein
LRRYDVLDSPPESAFRRIVELARTIFEVPSAILSFLDAEQEWIVARVNVDRQVLPLNDSFGASTLQSDEPLVVADTTNDERFPERSLLPDASPVRFYAGAPLVTPDGVRIGTLAVMDTAPHSAAPERVGSLRCLASLVIDLLEPRRPDPGPEEPPAPGVANAALVEDVEVGLDAPPPQAKAPPVKGSDETPDQRQNRILKTAVEQARDVILITEGTPLDEPGPRITYVNPAFSAVTGYEPREAIGKTPRMLQGPETEPWVLHTLRERLEQGRPFEGESINYRKDGTPYVNHWSIAPVHDESGTLTHWVSVQRDVTDNRQMEKRLLETQERERRRIAHEMHEEMGGLLASLQMAVNAALPNEQRSAHSDKIEDLRRTANELSRVVRTLTERLHPRVLGDYGLPGALERLTKEIREREGVSVDLYNEVESDEDLPSLVETIAYRGVREGLTNVARHAEADHAQIVVNREPKKLRLHVLDDGVGFDPAAELSEHDQSGLAGIRERVVRLNGRLTLDSAPDAGTRLSMTLPLTLISLLK